MLEEATMMWGLTKGVVLEKATNAVVLVEAINDVVLIEATNAMVLDEIGCSSKSFLDVILG